MSKWLVLGLAFVWSSVAYAAPSAADTRPFTFSNLVIRIEGEDSIGLARANFRVLILEELRSKGFRAVGAENVVFNIDKSGEADLALGGTIRVLNCRFDRRVRACRLAVDWELLKLREQAIVYRSHTAFAVRNIAKDETGEQVGKQLVLGALNRLLQRPRFRAALQSRDTEPEAAQAAARYRPCMRAPEPLPAGAEAALNASVIVAHGQSHGSGFFLSDDGLVLTAAHVAQSDRPIVKLRDGRELPATVVRRSRKRDAALLRVSPPDAQPLPCLPLTERKPGVGEEIYAIGAPTSEQLGFTLTRGITSGVRELDGQEYLQTDASVSPGNSGGPLVGLDGRVHAIVSWKVSDAAVEGLAFGVPIASALSALAISAGDATTTALTSALSLAAEPPSPPIEDVRDDLPSLDPVGDKARADDAALSAATPGYVHVLQWGGLGVAATGGTLIALTYLSFESDKEEDTLTRDKYERQRLFNDIGWVMGGVGLASFVTGLLLKPSLDDVAEKPKAKLEAQAGFGWVGLKGQY